MLVPGRCQRLVRRLRDTTSVGGAANACTATPPGRGGTVIPPRWGNWLAAVLWRAAVANGDTDAVETLAQELAEAVDDLGALPELAVGD